MQQRICKKLGKSHAARGGAAQKGWWDWEIVDDFPPKIWHGISARLSQPRADLFWNSQKSILPSGLFCSIFFFFCC
jgi:hypothetical protein